MSPTSRRIFTLPSMLTLLVFAAATLGVANAQNAGGRKNAGNPLYVEYRGVRIGMESAEVRKKLGNPADKVNSEDYFFFSEKESARIYYDKEQKVSAVVVNYIGDDSGAPLPKVVLGVELDANRDGTMYKIVRYPAVGYWVSYHKTGGPDPRVTVTMQKIQ